MCLAMLIIISALSAGFNNEINKKISSIDGHYRINDYYQKMDSNSANYIKNLLSLNPSFK